MKGLSENFSTYELGLAWPDLAQVCGIAAGLGCTLQR